MIVSLVCEQNSQSEPDVVGSKDLNAQGYFAGKNIKVSNTTDDDKE